GSTTPDLSHASSDIFYLDLKNSFNTFSPTWIGMSSNLVNELTLASATTSKDYIILFGGESNGVKNNPINVFDVSVQQWINPTIRGEGPGSRIGVDIVSGEGNKVYIYGGNKYSDSGQYIWFEELRILNALDFSWEPMIPGEPRALYTSVLLHGGVIAFIGGYVRKVENGQFSRSLVEMNEITLFNTFEAKWYKEIAGGEVIEKRHSHSAIITSDGRVIIYGGSSDTFRMVMPVLAVLKTESFEWSVPVQMFGPDLPPPLTRHTADLYMNYMIVAFDTNNYQWITSYSYSNASTSKIPPQRK
ncbi:13311_t:CDS:2, partial [Funneliformis mosseae]